MKKYLTLLLTLGGLAASVHGASIVTVNVSALAYNGVSLADGSLLPQGDLIRVGYFNLTDDLIQANNTPAGLSFLDANFVQFGTAVSGQGVGSPGYFSNSLTGFTGTSGLIGKQIYLWVLDSPTLASATQEGVFYLTGNTNWLFPDDSSANPLPANAEVADLTGNSNVSLPNAHVVLGTFPGGDGNPAFFPGSKTFNLTPVVPEPSSIVLLAVGAVGLFQRRRRNS
jgi:hypothetical protein